MPRLSELADACVERLLVSAHAAVAQLEELNLRLVAEADQRGLAAAAGAPSTRAWLRARLHLSPVAAKRQELLAQRLNTSCLATRVALSDGKVDVDQASVIAGVITELPADTAPDLASSAEAWLIDQAETFDASSLAQLGQHVLDIIDPDGSDARLGDQLAREEARYAKRSFAIIPDLEGMIALRGGLDAESGAMLRAALDPFAAPRPSDANGPDSRSGGQHYADALVELARRGMRSGELPSAGGEPAQIVVTVDEAKLRSRVAPAWLDTGDPISPGALRRIACDASVIPAVLGGTSQPLDLGRQTRLISGALRRALVLRDRGCAFPGCTRPPSWCDGHHMISWVDGGPTTLDNSVLLCGHHHRLIHKGEWAVRLGRDKRPDFLPPAWIDPQRRPLRNTLHERR